MVQPTLSKGCKKRNGKQHQSQGGEKPGT